MCHSIPDIISLILFLKNSLVIFSIIPTCFGESGYQRGRNTAFIQGRLRNWISALKLSIIKDTLYC